MRLALLMGLTLAAGCGNPAALRNREGIRLAQAGRYREAAEKFKEATARDPRGPALWYNLADCLDVLGERGEAAAAYGKALELSPRHVKALMGLARLRVEEGDCAKAQEYYREALRIAPGDAEALRGLAAARAMEGTGREARTDDLKSGGADGR